jgi:hypothetical protein
MTTTQTLVNQLKGGMSLTADQESVVHQTLRDVVRAEGQLRQGIASVQDDLRAVTANLDRGLAINELGVLRWHDVDRLVAVRHERINALVGVLVACGVNEPTSVANYMVTEATAA